MGASQSSRQQKGIKDLRFVTLVAFIEVERLKQSTNLYALKRQEELASEVIAKAQRAQVVYCYDDREPYPGYNALLAERIRLANEDSTSCSV